MISTDIGIWVSVMLVFATLSTLFKDNPVCRVAEHLFVGCSAGYFVLEALQSLWATGVVPLGSGRMDYVVPLIIGVLMFTRFTPKYAWLARYGVAMLAGVGTGVIMLQTMNAQFVSQILAAVTPPAATPLAQFSYVVGIVFTIFPLFFFIFTRKAGTTLSRASKIGRYCMLIAFGAAFGTMALSNLSLLIGQLQLIVKTWLGLGPT